jgi:hypothetical protein
VVDIPQTAELHPELGEKLLPSSYTRRIQLVVVSRQAFRRLKKLVEGNLFITHEPAQRQPVLGAEEFSNLGVPLVDNLLKLLISRFGISLLSAVVVLADFVGSPAVLL